MPTYPPSVGGNIRTLDRRVNEAGTARLGPVSVGPGEGHLRFTDGVVDTARVDSSGMSIRYRGGLRPLTALTEDFADLMESHTRTLAEHIGRLNGIDTRLDGHDSTLASHGSRLNGHDSAISAHNTRINNAQSAANTANSRAGALEGRASTLEGNISSHNTRINNAQSAANTAQSRADSAYTRAGTGISNAATAQARANAAHALASDAATRAQFATAVAQLTSAINKLGREVGTDPWIP